jgi:UPF0716 protein FxsA
MGLLGRLAFLFVIVPVIELMILIELGRVLGLLPTLLLILLTGAGGAILTRLEGLRVFFQFRQSIAQAQIPGQAILDGVSVLIGGAFLITPGVLTDVLGFSWTPKAGNPGAQEGTQPRRTSKNEIIFEPEEQ